MSNSTNSSRFEILIVDDDKVVSLLHKNHIRRFNSSCSPIMCYNGQEALDYLLEKDEKKKNFLIFLDLNMPVIDGWGLLDHIEEHPFLSNISIVIVTSSIHSADETRAAKYKKVIFFCRKPLTEESIQKIIALKEVQHFSEAFPSFQHRYPSSL